MKPNSFRAFLLFLLALVLVIGYVGAFAQSPGPDRGAAKPARKEMRAYVEQNVLPVVRQQRQKLEAQLSTEDKAQLATYRAQLKEVRQRGQALRQRPRAAGTADEPKGTCPELTDAQQQQLQQLRSDTRAIMLNVAPLARKYEASITRLAAEIAPQKARWTTDLKAIMAKYAPADQPQKPARFAGERHRGQPGHFFRPTVFLLMDPSEPQQSESKSSVSTAVFPNPSAAANQLEYTVVKAGPVTVELLDGRGTTLRTVVAQQTQDKGPHTLAVQVDDLPNGTYFYKITTRSGTETKRFVKQ